MLKLMIAWAIGVLVAIGPIGTLAQGFLEGREAYRNGDYATALRA